MPDSARQFGRFTLVGVSNTVLSYIAYAAFVAISAPYLLAGAAGFAVGAVNGYRLNRRWTFGSMDSAGSRVRYVAVQLAGLSATTGLLWLFVDDGHLHRLESYALTIPLVTLATFLANRTWAFKSPSAGRELPSSDERLHLGKRRRRGVSGRHHRQRAVHGAVSAASRRSPSCISRRSNDGEAVSAAHAIQDLEPGAKCHLDEALVARPGDRRPIVHGGAVNGSQRRCADPEVRELRGGAFETIAFHT